MGQWKDGDIFWAKNLRLGMKYTRLGSSDLVVSHASLGTMTWGQQNTDEEAAEQLNVAFDEFGVNLVDTAEIYPAPPQAATQGATDRAIGKWLKTRKREDVILASKVAGRSSMGYLRDGGGETRVLKDQVVESVDKTLKRLGTDYLDLLQVHWPDRYVPLFGGNYYDASKERDDVISMEEQLRALDAVVKSGKVRYIGLSNETPFGVAKFVELAEREGLPRVVSVQNSYSLLCRADTELSGLVEACRPRHCDVGILAYSPLAGGVLTGKYQDPRKLPEKARLQLFPGYMGRYRNSPSDQAVQRYTEVALSLGLTPAQMAMSWCYSQPFLASTIVGATSIEQLRENLCAANCGLNEIAQQKILDIYMDHQDPTKVRRPAAAAAAAEAAAEEVIDDAAWDDDDDPTGISAEVAAAAAAAAAM